MLQNQKIENLEALISKVRPFLRRYLEERNIEISNNGMFSCINPSHKDEHPSCGFIPSTNEEFFHCFSCGARGNITNAAHFLEDKPIKGLDYISDNLIYLADKYGITYDTIDLTPEELYTRRVYQAYENAADIISEYQPVEYISQRNWPVSLCRELGIGSIRDYSDFVKKMGARGYERQFIEEIDLNSYMFDKDMLLFSVRDEKGKIVGFSARNMTHSKDSKKSKFINTSGKCPIYNKSNILYGLDMGRKEIPPIYIFEGYPDFVTAHKHGIKNACAIGGTALTMEHVDLLKEIGANDIILALDGDDAGQNRTEGLLDQYFGGDETIKVRILKFPSKEGEHDPDEFLEKYGVDEFRKLPLVTPFQWRLDRFNYDVRPEEICDKMMPLIVSDPNEIHREMMCKQLSERTGVRLKSLYKQLEKLIDVEEARKSGHVQQKIDRMINDLKYQSDDPLAIIEEAADELRQMNYENREDLHSFVEVISFVDQIKEVFEVRKPGLQGWTTGYSLLDSSISGLPKEDTMITFAGDSNLGKTGFMFELALRLAKNNPNIMVLFMSIDDSRQQALARLIALEAGLKIKQVSHPQENIKTEEDNIKLENGWRSIRKLIEENKFSIKDNSHGNTLDFAEGWIRWAKENNAGKEIAFFLDNFHKLGDEREKDERIRFKHASGRIHALKNKLHFTAICTMEIRKLIGTQKYARPSLQDISECVSGDTLLTDGVTGTQIPIKDIEVGRYVLSMVSPGKIGSSKVVNKFNRGKNTVYNITTRSGRILRATQNHPLYTPNGWINVGSLNSGNSIAVSGGMQWARSICYEGDLCRFLGYLAGDGTYRKHQSIGFINKDDEIIDDVIDIVSRNFNDIKISEKNSHGSRDLGFTVPRKIFKPGSNPLRRWLNSVGILPAIDSDKSVPDFLFECCEKSVLEYVSGIIATDGTITKAGGKFYRIQIGSTSRKLLVGIQTLLWKFGFNSVVSFAGYRSDKSTKDMFVLSVSSSSCIELCKKIKIKGKKGKLVSENLKDERKTTNPGSDVLPIEFTTIVDRLCKEKNLPVRFPNGYWTQGKCMKYNTAKYVAEQLDNDFLKTWSNSLITWDEIISITDGGIEEVYDIEIENCHNFVANGLIAHNSKQMEYDNNLIGMVYSDMHARRQDSKIFWTDSVDGELVRKPVIEIDMQKNKITEFKGVLYYRFNPEYSRFSECSHDEVQMWQREYDDALKHAHDKLYPDGGVNPFISSGAIDAF